MKLRNKKTGEILEDVKSIDTSLNTIEIYYLDDGVLRMKTEKNYHLFLQNWEDYDAPKEPLIKNKKIRKAVRAWAEVLNEETIRFDRVSQGFSFGDGNLYSSINFDGFVFDLADGKKYTITELCGEEEE